jgi:hypothetical protein
LSARFRTEPRRRCRVAKEDLHLQGEVNGLMSSSIASSEMFTLSQMFYLLKHLPLLYLLILKQTCNNIFYFNLVFICFVYVFAHSCFVKNPSIDLEEMNPSFQRWFCHKGEMNTLVMSSYTLPLKCYTSTNVLSFEASFASLSGNP